MAHSQPISYGDSTGTQSSVAPQTIPFYYYRNALKVIRKKRFFSPLASIISLPKYWGKTIKRDRLIGVLDDRNINDQGIDAKASDQKEVTIIMTPPDGSIIYHAVGEGIAGQALTNAKKRAFIILKNLGVKEAVTDYDTDKGTLEGLGWSFEETNERFAGGNLMGSSTDIGVITEKLPIVGELGGRFNRIGFHKEQFEAKIDSFGFFFEYTEDSLNFDNDAQLLDFMTTEAHAAAAELIEKMIGADLINNAGIVMYGGDATSSSTVTGETSSTPSVITYNLLKKLDKALNKNNCPMHTKMITGTRLVDTKTIDGARFAYIGYELLPTLEKMVDYHGNPAFVPLRQYAANTTPAVGEVGSISNFRIIVVPDMLYFDGAGANVTDNDGYMIGNGNKYNIYPFLVVGDDSFSIIGYEGAGGKTQDGYKFKVMHQRPGIATMSEKDPYGKIGRYSIQWWYGFMAHRPERIGLIKAVAELS